MAGFLTPDARLRVFSDLGVVLPGGKLLTYAAGTSTPLATYSDVALGVPNANPVIASASGLFGPVFLTPGTSYKFVLTDAADVQVWTQDDVAMPVAGYIDGSTILAANGAVGAPGVSFSSDPDTGLYRDGANGLALATAGVKALGIDSTGFIDSPTQPRCVAFNNAVQSLSDNTITALALNAEDVDVGALHDTVTTNSRIGVVTGGDGFYLVIGVTSFAANATGVRVARIRKNGATDLTHVNFNPVAGIVSVVVTQWLGTLVATDYVELTGFQNSGSALDAGSATRALSTSLSLVKLW